MHKQPTILVAALNWGIGHATRDIPIIDRLLQLGCRVLLASDGAALSVWRRNYPELETIELPSWNIEYQKSGSFTLKMASRAPYVMRAIREEMRVTNALIDQYEIDAIISDNRFGVHSKRVPTVFITHQISLRLNGFFALFEPLLNLFNHHYIKKFDTVWVPDFKGSPNLSGELSHKHKIQGKLDFIGPISRFMDIWDGQFLKENYDVAVVLSGVEPQRSLLEEKLIEQLLPMTDLNVILVQGRSRENVRKTLRKGFEIRSFMDSEELMQTFLKSKYIICRSGYSTILDLAVLKQTALMIPTPGQTEQEYLAEWMSQEKLIVSQNQESLDLKPALNELEHSKGFDLCITDHQLNQAIQRLIHAIEHSKT